MAKISFHGPLAVTLAAAARLWGIGAATYLRHALGRRMAPDWDADFETGIRFWRGQFTRAMGQGDMARGRLILDAVQTDTDDLYEVRRSPAEGGVWHIPHRRRSQAVLLYFHGGGYTFHGRMNHRFADLLAHHTGAPVFAADYRMTPEHPYPAQAEDAMCAWGRVTSNTPPERVVLVGDSAGGHMALMLLLGLRDAGHPQPALCIGLCPWTDIGAAGQSLHGNDRYDMVQGWMALQFGRWLDPEGRYGRAALSPVAHDFRGLTPLYLQAGGREILRDMIVDFAEGQAAQGADVMLDLWPDMPHDFQLYDSLKTSSTEAVARIAEAVRAHVDGAPPLTRCAATVLVSGLASGRLEPVCPG